MKIKSIKIILIFLIFLYSSIVYGSEVPETDNQPIRLNDNEILFLGGWKEENINHHGIGIKTIVPARIYNIKEKKFVDLNSQMKVPRNHYVAAKTGDKVLITGGMNINYKLTKTTEIYDITKNQFEQINNSLLQHWDNWSHIFTLKDNKIFLIKHCKGEIFNPQNNIFSIAGDKDLNSKDNKSPNVCRSSLLKDGRIAKYIEKNFELYNPYTNEDEFISVPDYARWNQTISQDNGNLLFFGRYNEQKGIVFEFNPQKNEFNKITELSPGAASSGATLLNSDVVLMKRGVIRFPFFEFLSYDRGKCFDSALYSISQKKMYRMKSASCNFKGKQYVFRLDDKSAIIFRTNKKPTIYKI